VATAAMNGASSRIKWSGGEERHDGFRIAVDNVEHREQDPRSRLTVTRLDDDRLRGAVVQFLAHIGHMGLGHDSEEAGRRDQVLHACEGLPEE
jgi:hypothetical protein